MTVFLPNSHKERDQFYGQKNAKTLEPCGGDQSDGFQGFCPFYAAPVKSAPHSAGQPRLGSCGQGRPWHDPACHAPCKVARKAARQALPWLRVLPCKIPGAGRKRCAPTQSILCPPPDHSPWRRPVTALAASLSYS